jgi:hypothetical protein
MTPQEKLKRLCNPKTAEDYGIGISFSELETFEEGREFIKNFYENYVLINKWPKNDNKKES